MLSEMKHEDSSVFPNITKTNIGNEILGNFINNKYLRKAFVTLTLLKTASFTKTGCREIK
jgi:hypothetical protein